MATNAHSTKKGPGRRHADGTKHGKPPVQPKGHFLGQHTNPAKRARREHIALIGRRQFLKFDKAERRTFKDIVS